MISEKWKRGFSKAITSSGGQNRQKVKDSFSTNTNTISEEESNDMEIEAYFQQLKSKTSVKNLWDGKSFLDMVDNDVTPDVSTDSESQLDMKVNSTLKNLHQIKLDSDEDEMRIDYIREGTIDENNNDVDEDSDDDINLMNNIHFAELEIDEVNLSDDDLKKNKKAKDFLPRLYSVDNVEVSKSDKSDDTSSFNSDDYRGLSKLDSEISSEKPIFKSKSRSKSSSVTEESIEDLVDEEISEVHSSNSNDSRSNSKKSKNHSKSKSYSTSSSSKSSDQSSSRKDSKRSESKKSRHSRSKSRSKHKESSYSDDSSSRSSDRTLSASDAKDLPSDNYSSDTSTSVSTSKKSTPRSKTRRSSRSKSGKNQSSNSENEITTPREKKRKNKASHVQTQTRAFIHDDETEDVLKFRYDWQRNEPSNIAAHCLDPVTIDVLTNYNPAVLASNDLMKYHLQLLQQHIEDSRRLYDAYANENMNNNYRYTTVEETKKYIEKNAPKVISFEEALKLAKEEDDSR